MKLLIRSCRMFILSRKQYYLDFRAENTNKNFNILHTASFFSLVLLSLLLVLTPHIIKSWKVTPEYYCFIPVFLSVFLFTLVYRRRTNKSYWTVHTACVLYCALLMLCIILVDVFPYPDFPSSFFPLILIVLPVIFILKSWVIFSLTAALEVIYVILVAQTKTPVIAQNDIFNSLVAMLFSVVVSAIVTNLRIRDNRAKLNYQRLSATDILTGLAN